MARSRVRYGDLHKVFRAGSSDLLNQIAHLAILFEDLRIEVAGVQAPDDTLGAMDTVKSNHRRLYFVRRTLVTLSEVAICIKGVAANAGFRSRIAELQRKHIQHVDDANSFFSKNIQLINRFRNEFGAHLDRTVAARATALLGAGTLGKVAFADQKNNNFVLQNHFAATILEAAILSRLEPGVDLAEEYTAVLKVIADSVLHTQRATQALVYGCDEGEVLFQVGDSRRTLRAGESILGPRGIPHAFSGVGEKPAHMLIAFTPAGKMEEFFRYVAVPNGPKMDAEVFARYEMQYVGPPLAA